MEPQGDSAPTQNPSPLTTPTTSASFCDPGPAAREISPPNTLQETLKSLPGDPVSIVEAAVRLDSIFLVGEPTKETLDGYSLEGRNILRPTKEIQDLTDEQGQALGVIPAEYWQLNCWSFRSLGQSTFMCTKLTVKQRIFAYCYYLHQVRGNPILKELFTQKRNALQGKEPEPGPKSSQGRRRPRPQVCAPVRTATWPATSSPLDRPTSGHSRGPNGAAIPSLCGIRRLGRGKRVRADINGPLKPVYGHSHSRPTSESMGQSSSQSSQGARKVRARSPNSTAYFFLNSS